MVSARKKITYIIYFSIITIANCGKYMKLGKSKNEYGNVSFPKSLVHFFWGGRSKLVLHTYLEFSAYENTQNKIVT